MTISSVTRATLAGDVTGLIRAAAATSSGTTSSATTSGTVRAASDSSSGTTTSNSDVLSSATSLNKDTFLKLLVAQLKNQDPSSPTDSTQFLAETAQFSLVEKFDDLSALEQKVYNSTQTQSATAMVGKKVTWTLDNGASTSGVVSAVSISSGTPKLLVGSVQVSLDSVTKVEPASTTSST